MKYTLYEAKKNNIIVIKCNVNGSFNIMRLGIEKCNCDVHTIVPADMRFVYNPIRIRI